MSGFKECCLSGYINDSKTPTGKEETIGEVPTYVAAPEDGSKSKTIVFVTDIFGWKMPNVRLLADGYAKEGFYAVIPDFFEGDSLPHEFLQNVEPNLKTQKELSVVDKAKNQAAVATTLPPWAIKHREAVSKPIIEKFFADIRRVSGVGKVGCIGFCWGGRYAVLGTQEDGFADAGFACHPALLAIPDDFNTVNKPLAIALGDQDSLVDKKQIDGIIDVMEKKTTVPHEIRVYENQVHGFTVRGDWSSEEDKKAMDEATKQGVDWFNKYLK